MKLIMVLMVLFFTFVGRIKLEGVPSLSFILKIEFPDAKMGC